MLDRVPENNTYSSRTWEGRKHYYGLFVYLVCGTIDGRADICELDVADTLELRVAGVGEPAHIW